MDANSFTCTIVNRSKRHAESHLTVRNNKGSGDRSYNDITCSFEAYAEAGAVNEVIAVASDDYDQFLQFSMRVFGHREPEERLSAAQVADSLWRDFVQRAGIDYE
jgi:hypothetical protein